MQYKQQQSLHDKQYTQHDTMQQNNTHHVSQTHIKKHTNQQERSYHCEQNNNHLPGPTHFHFSGRSRVAIWGAIGAACHPYTRTVLRACMKNRWVANEREGEDKQYNIIAWTYKLLYRTGEEKDIENTNQTRKSRSTCEESRYLTFVPITHDTHHILRRHGFVHRYGERVRCISF